jgi:hypothetical protein
VLALAPVPVAVCWPVDEIVNVAHALSFAWVPIAVAVMVYDAGVPTDVALIGATAGLTLIDVMLK